MRTEILKILREKAPEPVSGQELADKLGITRTAVWKHIQSLKKMGYEIEAHTKKGYIFISAPDKLLPEEIGRVLHTKFVGRHICYQDTVRSTNEILKQLAGNGAEDGTLCVAEEQTGGKGRLSRGWFSPYGKGLWFSLLLKPSFLPQEAPKMTLLAAVAVVRAIRECCGVDAMIKWPNDVLLDGRKLVGILTEMSAEFGHINFLVVGIGINVCVPKEMVPENLRDSAVSIADIAGHPIDRVALLGKVLDYFEEYYERVLKEGFQPVFDKWREYSTTLGRMVKVVSPDKTYLGTAIDIDPDGALLVRKEDGVVEKVLAGDVSIRPASGKGKYNFN
ncbi:MAG: biotin--[acetyl-CoA-carboxylase] ligase [Acidaminococcus sp.]|jgi:BirA family biotin operon repressor/biotin-[acetyl-CoA-carboxylase] ligase|nr:biotin--[acetyl-CoA-carboxylase] ligase [Acidaminococcus sp.]MCI2100585.1 biotin--[acetyl-CoA-carboxylase] ligase [Acidaminococcus sp.]MCI2116932.1 biotin--[acetyl-CoA-carboxylase] ligase [Acidaminococcus sp.]